VEQDYRRNNLGSVNYCQRSRSSQVAARIYFDKRILEDNQQAEIKPMADYRKPE
jgi:hypothetical protein